MRKTTILIVDDEPSIRFGIGEYLRSFGFDTLEADTCKAAEAIFEGSRPDAAIIDLSLPDGNGLDLLARLKGLYPDVPLIILTAHGSIDLAVRAIKEGAEHFLTKPVALSALLVVLQRLLEQDRNRQKQRAGKSGQARASIEPFLGNSPAIRKLAEQAARVLISDSPILIHGETGSGKGVLARWLHANGPRADEAFVDLNCASLSREFLETELFGHEKGAFTSAFSTKLGLLEVAHRGTVFLDEIGDMDLAVQPKLLKVLEEKRFRRLGDNRDRSTDIRLVAASHQDLVQLVREKRFRSDLYYRISAIPLLVPALRERVEDIPMLAQRILEGVAADLGRRDVSLSPESFEALSAYHWPGNIRELRNVLERAVLLSGKNILGPLDLRFDAPESKPVLSDGSRLANRNASDEASGGPAEAPFAESGLTDEQWRSIQDLLPPARGRGGQWRDHRQTLDALLATLRSGGSWRDIPASAGPWQTVYDRFNRWLKDGTLDRVLERLHLRFDRQARKLRETEAP